MMDTTLLAGFFGLIGSLIGGWASFRGSKQAAKDNIEYQEKIKQDEQKKTLKKICILIQPQLKDIEDLSSRLNSDYENQKYLKNIKEYDMDIGISHEVLLKYLDTEHFRLYIQLIKEVKQIQPKIDMIGGGHYYTAEDLTNNARELMQKAHDLNIKVVEIIHDGRLF